MFGGIGIVLVQLAAAAALPPAGADAGALDNASCVDCHEPEAREWADSQHRTAFTEATFQTAFAREPRPFCRDCHAPEAATDPKLGIACITCHVRGDTVLAAPGAHRPAPHPVTREAAFASVEACAGCHQFEFGDAQLRERGDLMQATVDEHAQSPFAETSCAHCHMPRVNGHRSHAFAASRDPSSLRNAVIVHASRLAPDRIVVTLRAGHVGHAVPTGDLLRRLEVGARTPDGVIARRFLARHFGPRAQASGIVVRSEIRDDRVPADGRPRRVELRLRGAAEDEVTWWVRYQRVAHHTSLDEHGAELDGEVVLAQGVLGPEGDR